MAEKELINEIKEEKPKMTKGEIFLFINGINCVFIADALSEGKEVKEDPRKYRNIISGDYSRIEKDTLKNLCTFLGVSTDLVLDGLYPYMKGSVYIHSQKTWISFNEYILLKCTGHVLDLFANGTNGHPYIKHIFRARYGDLNRENDFMKNFVDGLNGETLQMSQSILRPNSRRFKTAVSKYICPNEKKYEEIIKPYFLEVLTGDDKTKEKKFNHLLERRAQQHAMSSIKSLFKENSDDEGGKIMSSNPIFTELERFLSLRMSNFDYGDEFDDFGKNENEKTSKLSKPTSKKENSKDDELVKDDPSESNQDTADNNDDSNK